MKKDIPRSNPVIIAPVPNRRKGPVYYQPTPVPSVTERMALSGLKKGYGDHVMVDIASARAAEGIPEKEKSGKDGGCSFSIHLNPDTNNLLPDSLYAVKVGLCENFDGNKVLWRGETFITSAVRGPIPVFINSNGSPTKEVPSPHVSQRATDFESGVKTTMDALRKKKKKNNNVTVEKTQQPSKVEISGNGSCPSRISVTTNFAEGGYLAFELLHMNSSTSNGEDPIKKVIATTVFPLYFFHSFTAKTVISAWYPMREVNKISKPVMESQETLGINKTLPFIPASCVISEIKTPNGNIPSTNRTLKEGDVRTIKAIIHLVFEVPGGCPQQVERPLNSSPAQNMLFSMRVHDAKLFRTVEEGKTFLEKLVVTSSGVIIGDSFRPDIGDIADGLDVLLKRPPAGMYFSIRMSSGEKQSFRRTCHAEKRYKNKKTPSSYYPIYNQRFSWYQTEVKDSKCVSIYLKAKCGKYGSYSLFKFKPRVIGVAHIPIQYFLSHHSSTGADIIAGVTPPNEFPTLSMQKPVLLVDPDRPFILRGVAYVTIEAESTTKTVTDTKTGNTTTTYNFKKISKDPEPCGPRSIPDYGCAAEARRKSNDIQRDTLVPGKCVDPDNTNRLVYLDAIEFLEVGHLYKLDPNADTDVPQPDTDTESEESDTGESEVVDMKKCEPKK